jgi:hypothetical protein
MDTILVWISVSKMDWGMHKNYECAIDNEE